MKRYPTDPKLRLSPSHRIISSFVLRCIIAVASLVFALDLLAFSLLAGLLGYFSGIARPVAVISSVLFAIGGITFAVASFLIVFMPGALCQTDRNHTTATRSDRIAGMVVGSIGGSLVGLIAFICLLSFHGSIDVALFSFHAILVGSAFLAYCYPNPMSELSLDLVDGVKQLLDGIFG
ncbi:hypothetical protein [Rubripirellula tenax]|uniref:hypothetical protein n=1 Tax=Rubripirellula tenax TaxID=2528015 RepID=UPI0011B580D0|nr:hypothetical protein [Rubripirellula tenax]